VAASRHYNCSAPGCFLPGVPLGRFGAALLRGVCDPSVLAVYRVAIAESERSPEIARVLDRAGRAANQAALTEFLARAKARGLVDGDPATMTSYFVGLLWRDLLVRLLLQVTDPPTVGTWIIGPGRPLRCCWRRMLTLLRQRNELGLELACV
jgi:hypothetical protein